MGWLGWVDQSTRTQASWRSGVPASASITSTQCCSCLAASQHPRPHFRRCELARARAGTWSVRYRRCRLVLGVPVWYLRRSDRCHHIVRYLPRKILGCFHWLRVCSTLQGYQWGQRCCVPGSPGALEPLEERERGSLAVRTGPLSQLNFFPTRELLLAAGSPTSKSGQHDALL